MVGWFLSPVFSNMIINYDLSSYGLEVAGVELTTLGSFVNQMIINNVEGIEGALGRVNACGTYEFLYGYGCKDCLHHCMVNPNGYCI